MLPRQGIEQRAKRSAALDEDCTPYFHTNAPGEAGARFRRRSASAKVSLQTEKTARRDPSKGEIPQQISLKQPTICSAEIRKQKKQSFSTACKVPLE